MEPNDTPLSPFDMMKKVPVEAQVDPSFINPMARENQTTHEQYAEADLRNEYLSGHRRLNHNQDGSWELVRDESSDKEIAASGIESEKEAGSTGYGKESFTLRTDRVNESQGIFNDALTKSAAEDEELTWNGTGRYWASVWDSMKIFSSDSTPDYTALQEKLRTEDPSWDGAAQTAAIEKLKKTSPDLFSNAQMLGVNVELLAVNSKNKLVFEFAIHDSVHATQQGIKINKYNAINPHWWSNMAMPFRENVGEGLQDPGFMRDTIITTAATLGLGTGGVIAGRMALTGGRTALLGRALQTASREALLLTGPTVGLVEGPVYRLASATAFSSLDKLPRILASRAVALFTEGAFTGLVNASAQAKYDHDWHEAIFGDSTEAFKQDQSQLLEGAALGGFVGLASTGALRLGLDGLRVGTGHLTKAGRAHYAPRNMGVNFKNFARSLGETFDTWATTANGQVVWGDILSSGRGVMFGDMIDNYLRKNLDQRDFTKILVNGERLWGQFDPHTVSKMNLDMKTATITARKFEEATHIAGEAAMRGAAGAQAAQLFGAMFDAEHLKANGLTDADVHTALDLYKVHGPSSRGSAVGAFLDQTSRDKIGTSFEGHAKNVGNLVDALMLDRRMERSGVSFVDTLNVAETHLGRNIDFASPADFRSVENLGRSARGMTSADQVSGAMRGLMNQADGTTDTQAPAGVRDSLVLAMSGGKKQFFVVDDTDPNYIVKVDTETGTTTTSTRTLQVDPKTGVLTVVHDMASDPDYKPENIVHADKMRANVLEKLKQVEQLESQKYMDAQKASLAKQKADATATGTPEGKAKSIKIEAIEAAMRMEKPITVDSLEKVFHMERGQAVAALVIMKALGLDDNEAGMSIASGFAGIEGFAAGASGQIDFTARTGQAAKALIRGSKASDMGTVVHEVGHYNSFVFLHSKASAERAAIGITEDMYDGMLAWAGATRDTIDLDTPEAIKAQEKIANGWSVYMQMALKGKTSANTPVTRLFHKLGDHIGDVGTAFKSQADLDKAVVMTPAAEAVFEKLLHRSANRIDDMFEQSFITGRWHKLDAKQKAEIGEHILGVKGWEDYKAKKDAKSMAIRKKTDPLVATAKVFTAKEAGDQLIASLKDNSSRKALSDFRKANGRNATKAEVDAVIAEAEMDLAMFNGNARILDIEDRGPRHNIEAANPTNLKTISSDTLLSLAETAKDGSLVHYVYSLGRIANNDAGGLGLKHNVVILSASVIADELNKRVKEAAAKVEKTKAAVAAAPTPDAAVRAHLAAERGVQVDSTPAVVAAAVAKLNAERELRAGAASPATTAAAVIEILTEPLPESVPVERAMEVRAEAVAELLTTEPAPTMAMLTEGGLTEASVEAITADLAALSARVEVTTPAENVAAHNAGTTTPAGPRETRTYVTEDGVPADLTPVQQAAAAAHQNIVHASAQAQDTAITQIATAETGTIEELVGVEVGVVPMDHMGVVIHNARLAAVAPEQVATAQATVATLTVAADTARSRVSPANAKKIEALARLVQDNPVRMGQINQILTNMGEGTKGLDEANRAFFEAQLRFTIASTALNDLTGMSDADLQIFTDVHFKLHGKVLNDAQESIIDRLTVDPKNATLIAEADKIFGKGGGAKLVIYIRGRALMATANEQAAVRTSTRFLAEPTNALKLQTALETLKTDPNNRAAQTIVGIHEAHQSRVRDSLGGHVVEEEAPVGKVDEFDQPNELLERQKALRTNPLSKTITAEHTLVPDWNPDTAPFDVNNPSPQFIAAWMMKNGNEGINGFADILKRPNTTIATRAEIEASPIVFNRIVELLGLGNVTGKPAVEPRIIDIAFLQKIQSEFDAAYGKRQAKITTPSAKLMETFTHTNQMAARSGNSLYALEFMKKAMTDPKQLDNISARLGIDPAADIFTKRAAIEAWARGEKTFNGKDMDVGSADKLLGQVQSFGRKVGDREDTGRTAGGLKDRKTTTSSLEPNMDKAAKSDKAYDDLCQQRAIMSFLGGELHSMLLRTGDTELADYLATRKAIWGQDGDYVENFNNARALRSSPQNPSKILTKSQLATLDLRLDERIEVLAAELDKQGHREVAGIVRDTRLGVAKGVQEVGRDIGPADPVRIMQQISSEFATTDIAKLVQLSFEQGKAISIDPFLVSQLLEFPLTAAIATGKINNAAAALDIIVEAGGPRASVAAKLLKLARPALTSCAVMGTIDASDKTMGVHFTAQGLITVNLRIHDSKIQETLLHEAVHAVTSMMLHRHFERLDPLMYRSRGMDYITRLENISQMWDCPPGVKSIIDAYLQYVSDQEGKLNRDGQVWLTESAKRSFGSFQDQTGEFSKMKGEEYEFDYAAMNINEFLSVSLSNPRFAGHLMKQEAWIPNPDASAFGDIMDGAVDLAAKFMGEDEIFVANTLMFKLYLGVSQTVGTEIDPVVYSRFGAVGLTEPGYDAGFRINSRTNQLAAINSLPKNANTKTFYPIGASPAIRADEKSLSDLRAAKGRLYKAMAEANPQKRVMNQPLSKDQLKGQAAFKQLLNDSYKDVISSFERTVTRSSDDFLVYASKEAKNIKTSMASAGSMTRKGDGWTMTSKHFENKWTTMLDEIIAGTVTEEQVAKYGRKMADDLEEELPSTFPVTRTMNQPLSNDEIDNIRASDSELERGQLQGRHIVGYINGDHFNTIVSHASDDAEFWDGYAPAAIKSVRGFVEGSSENNPRPADPNWKDARESRAHYETQAMYAKKAQIGFYHDKWKTMLDAIVNKTTTPDETKAFVAKMQADLQEEVVSIAPDRGVPARTMNQFNPNDAKRVDLDVTTRKDFKRWFGKSSVTNSDGEPMQVFLEKLEDANDWRINTEDRIFGKGNYFVAKPDKAHAGTVGYLSIQKPMDMDADADVEAWIAAVPERIRGDLRWDTMSGKMRLTNEVMYTKLHKKMTADERVTMLKDMGHDGITKINRDSRGKEINRTFVVFDKNQMDMRFDYGHIRTFLGANPAGLDKGGHPLELSHNGDMVFTSSASIKGRFGKDKLSVITRLQKEDTLTVSSPMVLSDADFRSGDVDLPVNVLRTAVVTVLQKAKAPLDQIAAVKDLNAEQLVAGNWKLDAKSVADAALLEGYKGVQFTDFADGRDVGDKWFIFSPTDVVPLDVTSTRTLNQKRMENDLAVRANVEGEAGKDVKAVEKRLKDLQDTVESRRRDLRSLGLHEETESRDLKHLLSIINGTPTMQEPSHMDILDRLGQSVLDAPVAFRAGKAIINLRDMTDDERREFVTQKMVPTIQKTMGQRITGSYSGSKLGKLSERMIGGAVDYANVANSDSQFLQFIAKMYDPSMDLRNAEIQGMLDMPTVDMANARLNNMYAKSGLMAARDKAMLVCKTDAELDDANNLAWKYLANRDGLPKDVKNRELVLMTIDAANTFNKEVGELKVKHGLLKESNHLEYGTIRKASELAYNDRKGFADALHTQALKKAQDAATKNGEVSLVTAEAMGWVDIKRDSASDEITSISIPDSSPLKVIKELPKEMDWNNATRKAFAVMLPMLSAEAQKQHAEGLVSSKGYKDLWKQATGSRGDSHTALRETMEIAANRYLGIDDLSASKSAKPRSESIGGGRNYSEERILTHDEIASNPELAKYFDQNIFGLTHDTLRGDVTDLVMTDMLTDFFGGQVRMTMLDMIAMLNKTGENFMGKHQLSSSEIKARQAGYDRVKNVWEHHTGKLTRSVDSVDKWYEELLNGARTAVMVASGLGATVGSIPELARAIVSSDSSRSGLAQLLPNLSKVMKLYNKRTAIQEMASAAHWIRLMSADNVLAKSDVMPTSPFHGLSYGGREGGYFNGWKTAWQGVMRMNKLTDSKVGKAVNILGLASKIPAGLLRGVNSYTTTLHIWNAQLNLTRDSGKFLRLAELLQRSGPKDLSQFSDLAKSVGLLPQEALDLSTAGLLNPVHIKQLIEAGKDQSNYTDGMLDVRKLFVWASKQDDPKVAEEAINKMGGYIGMTARRSNTEPTLLDVRINQSAFGRSLNVFMQFLLSHSVQEIGRRRRYSTTNYSKHLVGLFLCEVAAGAMRGYKDRYLWGSDKETLDEKLNRNPLETGLSYATSLPMGGSYQWIQSAARQLMYKGYNAATGEETFKERFNAPDIISGPISRSPSTIGRTAIEGAQQTGAAVAFMRDMMK
jgi:hypothetical protein